MSQQALLEIINRAVADYGFRLAVMWGTEDVVAGSDLTSQEAQALRGLVVPQLKKLPNPVEPDDQATVQRHLAELVS